MTTPLRLARSSRSTITSCSGERSRTRSDTLLLATNTHAASGWMREVWSRGELLQTRREDWILHPLDVLAILRRLEPEGHEFGSHDVDRDREDLSQRPSRIRGRRVFRPAFGTVTR